MDLNSGVNPVQVGCDRAELHIQSETVTYNRAAPPPYSPTDPAVTAQPIIHQTIIIQAPLKTGPIFFNCPRCHERVLTKVKYINTKKTHMLAGFICGLTFWCLLCCLAALPYCLPTFKKAEHYCPNCNTFLGDYSKL
ncbi:hypothetical protein K1T71_010761 [Dendrolimus kikuchii]|uniref:Uncharacterized protein n=1 Tax=Dendrolimus kikuchii TaxID=765133 RepID=A0ACC1CQ25_9NEOP|nr:hypothetical protein K1T71_010761 [Dendrolimus kikuchii]